MRGGRDSADAASGESVTKPTKLERLQALVSTLDKDWDAKRREEVAAREELDWACQKLVAERRRLNRLAGKAK